MQITPASLEHAHAVARIHVDSWRAAYAGIVPAGYLAEMSVEERAVTWAEAIRSSPAELLLAEEGGKVLGWVSIGPCRDPGAPATEAEIWALYVAPDCWSRGVGRALWAAARDHLAAKGYQTCSLWVFPENQQAIRFYEAAGFILDTSVPVGTFELGGAQLQEARYLFQF